ncbi:molybdopterin-guanine dinucleotide biosynthesis protein B [Thiolapillus brandeum]|uniref:Molybdopterin-guanine dinucleotide biosynthesis protein B n=1 Tax=Thiolapillus brandeum TaxID=1076588 RepID=A0A7U6JHC6_9GAMM|nr:molybdopterin-guanine dinucleotide biosynthesis protein B [Thiolapillus brandeum]BAO43553.1 molybdopterin-guanine dinucleotide biosynthesis protein B [Thiolapillus brandeum]
MTSDFPIPVLGFAAFSGSGKTSLLERLIPRLRQQGLRLALIKHSHHDFEMDKPGKDSDRLRRAGAGQILLASKYRTAWIREGDGATEPDLGELLSRLDIRGLDLVLVEGFRDEPIAKMEIHRPTLGKPLLCREDSRIIALACDEPPGQEVAVPVLALNDPDSIARFVLSWLVDSQRE